MGQDHPLTGRVWEVGQQRFVDEVTLLDRLVGVRYVVTGESHVNPDHHQLQLRVLKAMFGNGRRVAVGFEIFKSHDQATLDRLQAVSADRVDAVVDAFGRGTRHGKLWDQYRPLIRFAVGAGLPLHAMDLSRREAGEVMRGGIDALPDAMVERFDLDQPLPEMRQAVLTRDLMQAHCGLLFTSNLDRLILAQRVRDATMAARLETADLGYGALLLTGYGHARSDRGVPYLLEDLHQRGELVSVLLASVKDELRKPEDYRQWFGSERLPFDYVWFTPRVDDEDPCERLQRIYGKKADAKPR